MNAIRLVNWDSMNCQITMERIGVEVGNYRKGSTIIVMRCFSELTYGLSEIFILILSSDRMVCNEFCG
jgi:hypothetical protein